MHKNHKKFILNCFNKSAHTYDQYSNLQKFCGINLIFKSLKYICSAKNIIDLGCGSGLVTEKIAHKFHYKNFIAIDMAEKMLSIAHERLLPYHIKTRKGDLENFNFKPMLFNFLFSNLALHWSSNFYYTLCKINYQAENNALLAFSIPLDNTFLELENKNLFYSSKKIKKLLAQAGFTLLENSEDQLISVFDSWLDAIKIIKLTGTNYVQHKSFHSLAGNPLLKSLIRSSGPITLQYHIGFFIAQKTGAPNI